MGNVICPPPGDENLRQTALHVRSSLAVLASIESNDFVLEVSFMIFLEQKGFCRKILFGYRKALINQHF
ncbi:hypothetical protein ACWNXI_18145 [Caldibacillus thermoamylovorans]